MTTWETRSLSKSLKRSFVVAPNSGTDASVAAWSGSPFVIVHRAGSSAGVVEALVASAVMSMLGNDSAAESWLNKM